MAKVTRDAVSPEAVSYTHLMDEMRSYIMEGLQEKAPYLYIPVWAALCGAKCLEAVSYTHLDVYKRQGRKSSSPFLISISPPS